MPEIVRAGRERRGDSGRRERQRASILPDTEVARRADELGDRRNPGWSSAQRVTREQNQRADRERAEDRQDRAQEARRDLYARLNTTARAYRVAARDAVLAAERGESVDPAVLDTAKEAWAEQYSLAQMALPKDVHQIASALNRALGVGYSVVKQLPSRPDSDGSYERAKDWFSRPLSDGVHLLRITLRHDLGVEVEPDFEDARTRLLATLNSERNALVRLLASEHAQAPRNA